MEAVSLFFLQKTLFVLKFVYEWYEWYAYSLHHRHLWPVVWLKLVDQNKLSAFSRSVCSKSGLRFWSGHKSVKKSARVKWKVKFCVFTWVAAIMLAPDVIALVWSPCCDIPGVMGLLWYPWYAEQWATEPKWWGSLSSVSSTTYSYLFGVLSQNFYAKVEL